ncbi:MAG: hypothetical protein IKZ99_12440 [Salinivirgaceae bacterium]|nr:hypothetical protein [Salinivirgaceae bacterium]
MKKVILSVMCIAVCALTANAQFGSSMLKQAASKAAQRTTEKAIDKATDKAVDAIDKEIDKGTQNEPEQEAPAQTQSSSQSQSQTQSQEPVKPQSIVDIMKRLPAIPTVQQLTSYKSAELNEQAIRLLSSPVTSFKTQSASLMIEALAFSYAIDSATLTEAVYKNAELMTGLSREELDKLAEMSEEEQQAYLETHYRQGQAEAAIMEQALDASKYLEPLQPMIDEWEAIGKKADKIFEDADNQCKPIYAKYAKDLESEDAASYKSAALKYYGEVAPILRKAAIDAMKIRMDEQIPAAEKIEKEMVPIRAKHQDLISALLNYPQMTASQYFTDAMRMFDIPTYK